VVEPTAAIASTMARLAGYSPPLPQKPGYEAWPTQQAPRLGVAF
jgi:hypothetical protein